MKNDTKSAVKKAVAFNSYFNAAFYNILSMRSLKEMVIICDEASKDDSIADITWLKTLRHDIEDGKRRFYTTDCNFSNSHIYGIWYSLFGDLKQKPLLTPSVEHGLIFHNQLFNDVEDTARAACVTFGAFRKSIIRQYTNIPIFCVGPYIHYATSFYDEQRLATEKKKNGKTLLVFPMHSTNNSELSVEINNYRDYLKSKQKEFDTILINTFWWNINDPLCMVLQSDGYRIVSAGFRDDIMFMSRLKSLIRLADLVVGDSIGTHVGYCIDCGVPFSYEPLGSKNVSLLEKEIKDADFVETHVNKIAKAFYRTDTITDEQRVLCDYYWGQDKIRTKNEIRTIAALTEEIMRKSSGYKAKFRDCAEWMLQEINEEERRLLQESLE